MKKYISALAVSAAIFTAADAEARQWMRVVGVAENDVLNIRAEPMARSADIGDLLAQSEVEILGFDPTGDWAILMHEGRPAYVAARFLELSIADKIGHPIDVDAMTYRVKDVAADDMLWVRAEPNAQAVPLDGLMSGDFVTVWDMRPNGWAELSAREGVGYASARYLEQAVLPKTAEGLPLGLSCFGTEPFWGFEIRHDGSLFFERVDDTAVLDDVQRVGSGVAGYPYRLQGADISAVLNSEICSDGMSDRLYPWRVDVSVADRGTFRGCCRIQNKRN
ncbi:MAG: hypothetical protein ACPGVK_06000 [Halocynthiibacter sp.]